MPRTSAQSPGTTSGTPDSRKQWRLFLALDGGLLAAFLYGVLGHWMLGHHPTTLGATFFGVVGAWLVFTLPICVLYLVGKPPVMTLAPLLDSAESRAFRKKLKTRQETEDDEFFNRFHAGTGISRDVPVRLRRLCATQIHPLLSRVHPSDVMQAVHDEIDLGDFLREVEVEFGVTWSREDMAALDGSFDSVVRWLQQKARGGR
jgi:hypothetical protein